MMCQPYTHPCKIEGFIPLEAFPIKMVRWKLFKKVKKSLPVTGFTLLESFHIDSVRRKLSNGDKKRSLLTGFTLIEIVIVVIIIAIVAGVVGVRLTGTISDASLMSSARSIAAMMALARYSAITDGLNYRVNYDIDMRRYWFSVEKDNVYNPSGRYQELASGVTVRDITTPRQSNIKEGTEYTTFMPDGRAEKCLLHLTNEKRKVYTIIIFKGIGRVKVLDYEFTE